MGAALVDIYDEAKRVGGLPAQIKLAMLTKLSSPKASEVPDTPELIAQFRAALKEATT